MFPVSPDFRTAAGFWLRLGFVSFGGPAGQIAILHREVVERRRWLDDARFADALNFCMLLPGPEALQLAIYLGWKMHGIRGGLLAGLGFILPAIVLLLGLSWIYVRFGEVPAIAGVLTGLKAAVIALVVQALARIGRRALRRPVHVALAALALVALVSGRIPYPAVLLVALAIGALMARGEVRPAAVAPASAPGSWVRVLATGLVLWALPLALVVGATGAGSLWSQLYLFFSKAALVTFGGAYAVLGYVNQHLVHDLGWLTADQSVAGLALAETTPGPLVIVLQFMGYVAGYHHPQPLGPATSALLGALLASWATFLPSFVLIFLGAPYVERIAHAPRIAGALAAVTAAVVGVIAALAFAIAHAVILPHGWSGGVHVPALLIAMACAALLSRAQIKLHWVLAAAAIAGYFFAG